MLRLRHDPGGEGTRMLYMVEMDFPHADRVEAWQAWYAGHVRMLLTLPGFRAAQRFRAVTPTLSPWLAVYAVDGAHAFETPEYRAKAGPGGTGEWRTQMTNWRRNLVEGLSTLPEVKPDQQLVVVDRLGDRAPALPAGLERLKPVGLDRSIVERGVRVLPAGAAVPERAGEEGGRRVVVFRPITPRLAAGEEPAFAEP